jgi:hypothetical protein
MAFMAGGFGGLIQKAYSARLYHQWRNSPKNLPHRDVSLPVWRSLIRQGNSATCIHFAPCFAFHQHRQSALRHRQFRFLTGDDIRQVFDCSGQVCDFFFKVRDACHGRIIALQRCREKGRAADCVGGGNLSISGKMMTGLCFELRLGALPLSQWRVKRRVNRSDRQDQVHGQDQETAPPQGADAQRVSGLFRRGCDRAQ